MLRFDHITFAYLNAPGGARALDDVTFSVAPGEEVAVVGANGSGKSTLAKLANGILLPQTGTVTVDSIRTDDELRIRDLRERVGVVFQHPDDQIVATSVEDDVAFGPENLGLERAVIRRRVDEALDAVGLTGLATREPHLLSGGQKQRLAIAGALAMQPTYLILDEPTSMLDPEGRVDVLEIVVRLREAGHGIMHITHDLADVAHVDRVIVLLDGAIGFEGTAQELFNRPEVLASCGLELPPIARFAVELRRLGVHIPDDAVAPEALVEALWG